MVLLFTYYSARQSTNSTDGERTAAKSNASVNRMYMNLIFVGQIQESWVLNARNAEKGSDFILILNHSKSLRQEEFYGRERSNRIS